jgi:hypothetical protein
MSAYIVLAAGLLAAGSSLSAQIPPSGLPERLRSALSEETAGQVLREIEAARARQLPTGVLEHRVLELAAKGVSAADIMQEITKQHRALWLGREALRAAGRPAPTEHEIEAAGSALQKGVGDAAVSALAGSVPASRSLAVPLFVVSSLVDRGLPADDVVAAMHVWLEGHASDAELNDLAGPPKRPELTVVRATRAAQRPDPHPGSRARPRPGGGPPRRPGNH